MVFDNVEGEHAIDHTWPMGAHGSIILTTRNREAAATYGHKYFEIPLFSPKESLSFMLDINPHVSATKEEVGAAQLISERLGYMPLALNSVGSYTRMASLSYVSFLQHYDDFDTNLLFQPGSQDYFYEISIRSTWTMALVNMNEKAKKLMEILAFFDPDDAPMELLECHDYEAK
jgi:hypothetical protein